MPLTAASTCHAAGQSMTGYVTSHTVRASSLMHQPRPRGPVQLYLHNHCNSSCLSCRTYLTKMLGRVVQQQDYAVRDLEVQT